MLLGQRKTCGRHSSLQTPVQDTRIHSASNKLIGMVLVHSYILLSNGLARFQSASRSLHITTSTLNGAHSIRLNKIAECLPKSAPLLGTIASLFSDRDPRSLVLPPGFFEAFPPSTSTLTLHGAPLFLGHASFQGPPSPSHPARVTQNHPNRCYCSRSSRSSSIVHIEGVPSPKIKW